MIMPYIESKCPTCGSNLLALDVAPVEICVVCNADRTSVRGSGCVVEKPELRKERRDDEARTRE